MKITLSKSEYQLFLEAPMHLWALKHSQIQKQPTEFDIQLMNHSNKQKNQPGINQ